MNNPLDDEALEPAMKAYLTRVSDSVGNVPAERRDQLLVELADHIEMLTGQYVDQGLDASDAVAKAISMMGDARKTGRSCALTWYRASEPGSILAAIGLACVAGRIESSLAQGIYALQDHVTRHQPLLPQWANIAVIILAAGCCPGIFTGWFTPKRGAIGATAYVLLAGIESLLLVYRNLANGMHMHDLVEYSAVILVICPAIACVSSAIASRIRRYRYAGI